MQARIVNTCDRAIGTEGGLLAPGDSIEVELTPEQFKAWEGCDHAEIHNLDRPKGGRDKKATAEPGDQGSGE